MNILLLSAYDAQSHQYWRTHLVSHFPEHQWSVLTLPGRYFSWRIRGNSLSWAFGEQASVLREDYDLVIATSMTDLSALRGFVPQLANIPTLVYFHENQFGYPLDNRAQQSVEPKILNIYTALSADYIAFNSSYNKDSFFNGANALLKKLPDAVPKNCLKQLHHKCCVLPVPLIQATKTQKIDSSVCWQEFQEIPLSERPLLIAWAARWEYDKGPQQLLDIVEALEASQIDYRLCILGQQFRHSPVQFEELKQRFSHRIDQFGFAQSSTIYQNWLQCADIFLSSALHEFQGLAVLEAVQLSCIPCLPKCLVYPELFGEEYLYPENSANKAVALIMQQRYGIIEGTLVAPTLTLHWPDLIQQYREAFSQCLNNFSKS